MAVTTTESPYFIFAWLQYRHSVLKQKARQQCSFFSMGDTSRGMDTLLTALFGRHSPCFTMKRSRQHGNWKYAFRKLGYIVNNRNNKYSADGEMAKNDFANWQSEIQNSAIRYKDSDDHSFIALFVRFTNFRFLTV